MEEYQELGLSINESKVYETLIKFGKLGAIEVSTHSSVPYGKIYIILNKLINKGLVNVVPEKTKKFIPSNPESLIKLIEEKQKNLEKSKEKAIELKKFYEVKEKNPVEVGYGKAAFYKMEKEMPSAKKIFYNIKYTGEYRPEWERGHKEKIKKEIIPKELFRNDEATKENIKKWLKIHKKIRAIENHGVAMAIRDSAVLISLIKSNATLIIRDQAFTKLIKKMFESTYELAEEIK
jgi:sugar-specific transcriptional regulator TrmB